MRDPGHVLGPQMSISPPLQILHKQGGYIKGKGKYHMARNLGMELNLVVCKINDLSPNFIPPTYNTCI